MKQKIILFGLIVFSLASMGMSMPIIWESHLRREVLPEEIPGTWVFTEHTKEFFSEQKILGEPPEKLYLRMQKDGSFIARIPEEENHSHWVYRTLAGTWELEYKKDGFLKKNTLNLEIGFPKGTWFFNFSEEKGQLVLWQYIGDPDSMDFMEFIKED